MEILAYLIIGYLLICILLDGLEKLKKHFFPADEAEPDEPEQEEVCIEYDFYSVQQRLIRIQQTADQIQSIEHLITDIEITSPEQREMPLEMKWADGVTGHQHSFNLWMDGRASTQLLLQTAYQEREQLRTSLSNQIKELYSTVVTESVTETVVRVPERGVVWNGQ